MGIFLETSNSDGDVYQDRIMRIAKGIEPGYRSRQTPQRDRPGQQGITGTRQYQDWYTNPWEQAPESPNITIDPRRSNWEYNKFQTKQEPGLLPHQFRRFNQFREDFDYNKYPWSLWSEPAGPNAWLNLFHDVEDLPPRFNINRGGLMSLV